MNEKQIKEFSDAVRDRTESKRLTIAEYSAAAETNGKRADRLAKVLAAFVDAYDKGADDISDADLDNEQPRQMTITLGHIRAARLALGKYGRTFPLTELLP